MKKIFIKIFKTIHFIQVNIEEKRIKYMCLKIITKANTQERECKKGTGTTISWQMFPNDIYMSE